MKSITQAHKGTPMHRALSHYRDLPLLARIHNYVRRATCPFDRIAGFVPGEGTICDLGCGHGLFSIYLALSSPLRRVIGYDLSEDKISVAEKAGACVQNVEFHKADALCAPLDKCDAVTLVDVLYLMDFKRQEELIERISRALSHDGILIIKTTDTSPRWKYLISHAQECLAVKLLGITTGSGLYFLGRDDLTTILNRCGFESDAHRVDSGYPHSHTVFVCRKNRPKP